MNRIYINIVCLYFFFFFSFSQHAPSSGCFSFSFFGVNGLSAQRELMLYQSADLWSANAVNPAFFPKDKKIVLGLPGFGVDAAHSGDVGYNDLFRREGDRRLIDLGRLVDRLEPENRVHYEHRFETVSLGIRLPAGLFLQAGHSVRLQTAATYPKTLAQLLWNGNGPYVGQTLDIAPNVEVFDFNELSLGLGWGTERLRLGGRLKYLSGISALRTDETRQQATVFTDSDIYQLTLETDYAFHSASIISGIDTAGLGFDLRTEVAKGKLFSQNRGLAFDLGASVQLGERLTLSAGALDLGGRINWSSNAQYFASKGAYQYDGVRFPGTDIINAADSIRFDAQLDTLNDIFRFEKTAQTFETELPLRLYAGGTFRLSDKWTFGAVFFHQNSARRSTTSFGLNALWRPLDWLSLGGMYSVNDRSAANLGFRVGLHPGPLQLYLVSDNMLNVFTPYSAPVVNFRAGAALLF
jgi:hypothetical protein